MGDMTREELREACLAAAQILRSNDLVWCIVAVPWEPLDVNSGTIGTQKPIILSNARDAFGLVRLIARGLEDVTNGPMGGVPV